MNARLEWQWFQRWMPAFALVICSAGPCLADESEWIEAGAARDGSKFYLKKGTGEFVTLGDQATAIAAVERYRNGTDGVVSFAKVYVRLSACVTGMGELVTTDLNGNVKFRSDWVSGGGTISSDMAEFLCAVAKTVAAENAKDSIKGRYIEAPATAR